MTVTEVHTCNCRHCRVAAAGLGPGPYTPEQFARIAQEVVVSPNELRQAVDTDPKVIEARAARDDAMVGFEAVNAVWESAAEAYHKASNGGRPAGEYDAMGQPKRSSTGAEHMARLRELEAEEREAREHRDTVWKKIVRLNDRIKAATDQAMRGR